MDSIDIPLKNAGFQKKTGAIPHFRNIENIRKNHIRPVVNKLLSVAVEV
jgi:hypothetical protein